MLHINVDDIDMKYYIKKILRFIKLPFILKDLWVFRRLDLGSRFCANIKDIYPKILDKTIKTGFDRHYIYHTAWAARKLREANPTYHTDISSSLYFSSIVSAFIPIRFYDFRPADLSLSNLQTEHADLTNLPFDDDSVQSLSCMHVIEHIGLGRYGDPIDPEGDIKSMIELIRVLSPGGNLFFVVPLGSHAMIEFNAHRIYSLDQIQLYFKDLTLREFSLIPEKHGGIIYDATKNDLEGEQYACGCFWFTKNMSNI